MSTFTTKIRADKTKYPVLLSNGNLVARCDLAGEAHDHVGGPWRKPCYLFALVAGDLAVLEDTFETKSGRVVEPASTPRRRTSIGATSRWRL